MASGVDVYSDGVYTNINPHVVGNVFPNPRIAAVELQGVPDLGEQVSGGLIRDNLINLPERGALFRHSPAQYARDSGSRTT